MGRKALIKEQKRLLEEGVLLINEYISTINTALSAPTAELGMAFLRRHISRSPLNKSECIFCGKDHAFPDSN